MRKQKLEQAGGEFSRLRNLEEERLAHLEAASTNRKALCSHISGNQVTIDQVLKDDTTLADKIKTLFRG